MKPKVKLQSHAMGASHFTLQIIIWFIVNVNKNVSLWFYTAATYSVTVTPKFPYMLKLNKCVAIL